MSTTLSSFSGSPDSTKNELNETSPTSKSTSTTTTAPAKSGKTKNRKRVNSAEKRSQHNAIERQRRETLNGKFVSLARLLPSLANVRRPSKSAIVNGSIAHLNYQRNQRLLAAKLLRQACLQHDQVLEELNQWRTRAGVAPKDSAPVWTSEMDDICAVEKETFGVFTNEDGVDNDNDNDNDDDDMGNDVSFDAGMAASLSSLIGSRPSAEMDAMTSSLFLSQQTAPAANVMDRVNAMNWSRDFAFGSMSSTSSLPFNAFMSDNVDQSSTGSPSNSVQGNVLTPPDLGMYTHTPSPRSSLGEEMAAASSNPMGNNWSEQQLMFLQSLQPPAPVRQQSMPALSGLPNANFNQPNQAANNSTNMFNNIFAQHAQTHVPQAHTLLTAAAANGSDAFTQSLLAQMFPSQGVPQDSVEQWRKLAMAGLTQPAVQNAMHTVRPSVLRSNSMWEQSPAVAGF